MSNRIVLSPFPIRASLSKTFTVPLVFHRWSSRSDGSDRKLILLSIATMICPSGKGQLACYTFV